MEEKYNCSFYKDLMDEQCNIITKNDTILNIPTTALKKDIKLDCELLQKLYDNCLTFKIEKKK